MSAGCFPLSRIRAAAALAFFLCGALLCAEDSGWVLASEEFSGTDIPKIYEPYKVAIPTILLSRLADITAREVSVDEKKARASWSTSLDRIKLIQDRTALILERDKILLSPKDEEDKKVLRKKADDSIAAKNKELRDFDAKLWTGKKNQPLKAELMGVTLRQQGDSLYRRKPDVSLAKSLLDDKVSCLVAGTIEDVSGYMYLTVTLESGIPGIPDFSVSEAAPWDEVDAVIETLTGLLVPEIAKRNPVELAFSVDPPAARIFLDGKLVTSLEKPVPVFAGKHVISVDSDGYETALREYVFDNAPTFKVTIALVPVETVSVAFDTKKDSASLFIGTRYYGDTPVEASVPGLNLAGNLVSGEVTTWFVFRPAVSLANGNSVIVHEDTKDAKKRIDDQRSILYWSLGALYISLPVSMLSYGFCMNMYYAAIDGKTKLGSDYLQLAKIADGSKYVSIACGVNFAFQLVWYILAAEQVLPKTIH
jgi:hypothetical protein